MQIIDEEPGDIWFTGQIKILGSNLKEYDFKGFTYSTVTPIFFGVSPDTKVCKIFSSSESDSLVIGNEASDPYKHLPSRLVLHKKMK